MLEQHTERMADRRSLFGRERPVEPLGELRPVRLQGRGQLAGQFDALVEQVDVGVVVHAPLADRHAAVATDLRAGDALAGADVLQVHLGAAPGALRLEPGEERRAFLEQVAQFLLLCSGTGSGSGFRCVSESGAVPGETASRMPATNSFAFITMGFRFLAMVAPQVKFLASCQFWVIKRARPLSCRCSGSQAQWQQRPCCSGVSTRHGSIGHATLPGWPGSSLPSMASSM